MFISMDIGLKNVRGMDIGYKHRSVCVMKESIVCCLGGEREREMHCYQSAPACPSFLILILFPTSTRCGIRTLLQITMRSLVIVLAFSVALATASQSGMLRASSKGRDEPRQSGKGPFRKAKLDLGVPPKTIPGEGFDFFKKTKGLEQPDHFGTEVQRHTPYAELYLLCPTHSCLRERRTLVSAKDPVETKFVTLADYECFNAKDGTISQPYHPAKKDHGEAPRLHRWSCHSKFDCKESRNVDA